MKTRKATIVTIAMMILYLFSSCSDDFEVTAPDIDDPNKSDYVQVVMDMPRTQRVTYSMTERDESDIETIDVLVFKKRGEGESSDTFLYREKGFDIKELDGAANDNKRTFSVKIKQVDTYSEIKVLIYANVREVIEEAMKDGGVIQEGATKEDIINNLVFDLPVDTSLGGVEDGKWQVKPGKYTPFPMWGESKYVDLTSDQIHFGSIKMLRAVAKINIGLDYSGETASGLDNFFLEEFYLYNAQNKLKIAPEVGKLSDDGTKVVDVSVPVDAESFGGIEYKRRVSEGNRGFKEFTNKIYLAENVAGTDGRDDDGNIIDPEAYLDNTCVVIGGRFGTISDKTTYYRIDLLYTKYGENGSIEEQTYLPIYRNHAYRINITSVNGEGHETPEEAFKARYRLDG